LRKASEWFCGKVVDKLANNRSFGTQNGVKLKSSKEQDLVGR
jgi:hypothetical protein